MTEITVGRLEKAKLHIESKKDSINSDAVSIEGGLTVSSDAVEWLKKNHYQLKVAETFGPTGVAALIYPAV